MLLAYLRGHLKPKYDQGTRSLLRENIILEAISTELDVQSVQLQTSIHAAYAPLLQPDAAKELINKQQVTVQNLRYLAEFDDRMSNMMDSVMTGEHADLLALYTALEEAGLVGDNVEDIEPDEA